jgi:hypothetical protein
MLIVNPGDRPHARLTRNAEGGFDVELVRVPERTIEIVDKPPQGTLIPCNCLTT